MAMAVEATRQIMKQSPCTILIVTASVGKNAGKVFEAMGYGARDAVNTLDVFFKSLAQYWKRKETAVLLTGMGQDGAEGLSLLRSRGWHTMAQDEKSSVVYGMPKAAAQLNAAVEVLSPEAIADRLVQRVMFKSLGTLPPS